MGKEFEENMRKSFLDYLENGDLEIGYDPYAQELGDWDWLEKMVPGLVISSAGGLCPFQAEGLLQGYPFYYRERHGDAELRLAPKDTTGHYLLYESLWSSTEEVEEFRNGPDWVGTLLRLIEKLEKTPYLYEFPAKKLEFSDPSDHRTAFATDEMETVFGWGHSVDEAWNDAQKPSEYLLSRGWSIDDLKHEWDLRDPSPVPLHLDQRFYPESFPNFEVKVPEAWRNEEGFVEIPSGY